MNGYAARRRGPRLLLGLARILGVFAALLLVAAGLGLSLVAYSSQPTFQSYNQTIYDFFWQAASIGMSVIGLFSARGAGSPDFMSVIGGLSTDCGAELPDFMSVIGLSSTFGATLPDVIAGIGSCAACAIERPKEIPTKSASSRCGPRLPLDERCGTAPPSSVPDLWSDTVCPRTGDSYRLRFLVAPRMISATGTVRSVANND